MGIFCNETVCLFVPTLVLNIFILSTFLALSINIIQYEDLWRNGSVLPICLMVATFAVPVSISISVSVCIVRKLQTTCWFLGLNYKGAKRCCCIPHGRGRLRWENGDTLDGDWVKGCIHPEKSAVMASVKSGWVYTGQFKKKSGKPVKHGKGIMTYKNGNVYDGSWKNNTKNGNGVFTWSNGNQYIGDWKNNFRHGYGEMTWIKKKVYKGQWKMGLQNGNGTMKYLNTGIIYEGEWEKAKKHGHGKLLFSNGYIIKSKWFDNEMYENQQPNDKRKKQSINNRTYESKQNEHGYVVV